MDNNRGDGDVLISYMLDDKMGESAATGNLSGIDEPDTSV